jgi:hypothetical protein
MTQHETRHDTDEEEDREDRAGGEQDASEAVAVDGGHDDGLRRAHVRSSGGSSVTTCFRRSTL